MSRNQGTYEYRGGVLHPDCKQGKIGYQSKSDLRRILKRSRDKFGGKVNIYRCTSCGLFHNSSIPKIEYLRSTGAL